MLFLEPLPAGELIEQQCFEFFESLTVAAQLRASEPMVVGRAHSLTELRLLPLERLDLIGEGGELSLLLVAQPYPGLCRTAASWIRAGSTR